MSSEIDLELENRRLKGEFSLLGLDVGEVVEEWLYDPPQLNHRFKTLLLWVKVYRATPNREQLEAQDMLFPPVDPSMSPDSDWLRFEAWLKGEPTTQSYRVTFKDPATLDDETLSGDLDDICERLYMQGHSVEMHEGVPDRLIYAYLREELEGEEFALMEPNSMWHIDGCTGYCPGCIQRPWCDIGGQNVFRDDEEAGRMVLTPELAAYVSASPQSLEILRHNAERDNMLWSDDDIPA